MEELYTVDGNLRNNSGAYTVEMGPFPELNQQGVGYFYVPQHRLHPTPPPSQLQHHTCTGLQKPRPISTQIGFPEKGTAEEVDASLLPSFGSQPSFPLSSSSDFSDSSEHNTDEPTSNRSRRPKRKRREKLESFFQSLMTQVIQKQEKMHQQLMEVIERKDREHILREEAWRRQEIERARREQQIRSQESSRSLALISFIRNALGKDIQMPQPSAYPDEDSGGSGKGAQDRSDPNNKRWPSSEVQALITLRAILDYKFHAPSPKTPVWEEVSTAMAGMGFLRTPKKCKEKWENINKYYKKASASGRKRSENAKTCPYFHELEALYTNQLITNSKVTSPTSKLAEENAKE